MTTAHARYDESEQALIASGDWRAEAATHLPALSDKPVRVLDGAGIHQMDTNGAWLLLDAAHALAGDAPPALRAFQPQHQALLQLVMQQGRATATPLAPPRDDLLKSTGRGALALWRHGVGLLGFVGQLTIELLSLATDPRHLRWRELAAQVSSVFVGAIPIVIGMLFLLGVVFAYLLGDQAQQYGANIFVVDGLLMAILREISPVIVAILIAGRTGAAITAQLGAMKVADEIDAIATLGLSPFAVLVVPRILALLIAMPLLVFLGDLAGMAGGMLIAAQQLDISPHMFLDRVADVILLKTLLVGLVKAPVFAIFIGLIACRMGLSVSRDAKSVGEHTTSTVVQSVVAIIVLNAIFAILFVQLDI